MLQYLTFSFTIKKEMEDEHMDMDMVNRLKQTRRYLNLTQEYVANLIGIHRTSLIAIESGKRTVKSEELKKFSEIYGRSVDELAYGRTDAANMNTQVFAREFNELSEQDQREILNLMEFKKMMKEQRTKNAKRKWTDIACFSELDVQS